MTIYTATTTAQLLRYVASAVNGDTIKLAPGTYSAVTIASVNKTGNVTITSADAAHPAVLTDLAVRASSGLTFSVLELSGAKDMPFQVYGSSRIVLDKLDVHGTLNGSSHDDYRGMIVRDSSNVTVSNSHFHELTDALSHLNSNNITFTGNSFDTLRDNGIVGGGSSFVTISNNSFTNFDHVGDVHPDAIQFWTSNTTTATTDLTITGNTFQRGVGSAVQGIFLGNELNIPYKNVTVSNNTIIGAMYNGIAVGGAVNATVKGNVVIGTEDQQSWIGIRSVAAATVTDNIATTFSYTDSSVTASGNVQASTISAADLAKLTMTTSYGTPAKPNDVVIDDMGHSYIQSHDLFRQSNYAYEEHPSFADVDRIEFADGTLSFDTQSSVAQIFRLYVSALGRLPDYYGMQYWTHQLEAGKSLIEIANSFVNSAEFQRVTAGSTHTALVENVYQYTLGRASDPDGKAAWVRFLDQGHSVAELLVGFSESPEHIASTQSAVEAGLWTTRQSYEDVEFMYLSIFGRLPDADGLNYWSGRVEAGLTKHDLAMSFIQSEEYLHDTVGMDNEEAVQHMYETALHRSPDPAGLVAWTNYLDAGGSVADLALAFQASEEFRALALSNVMNGVAAVASAGLTALTATLFTYDEVTNPAVPTGVSLFGFVDGASTTGHTYTFTEQRMSGTAGADTLRAAAVGASHLYGYDGADSLVGSKSGVVSTFEGGKGDDSYTIYQANDVIVEKAGEGTDSIYAYVSYTMPTNVEYMRAMAAGLTLTGSAGNDSLVAHTDGSVLYGLAGDDVLQGAAGNDRLFGGDGNDRFSGGAGNDSLDGGAGNDTLSGNEGNDIILAGDGNDSIEGGTGSDTMTGGRGADTYVYRNGDFNPADLAGSRDVINDFSVADGDKIALNMIDAKTATAADDAFSFIGNQAFHGVAGELRFAIDGDGITVWGDTNGDKIADLAIHLTGVTTITSSSFVL